MAFLYLRSRSTVVATIGKKSLTLVQRKVQVVGVVRGLGERVHARRQEIERLVDVCCDDIGLFLETVAAVVPVTARADYRAGSIGGVIRSN